MDNASFHHAKMLEMPDNIIPLFIPPYSPELNPAERVWLYLKNQVTHRIYDDLEKLQEKMHQTIRKLLTVERVKSLTGNSLYIDALIK